jgi:hypothetical protein
MHHDSNETQANPTLSLLSNRQPNPSVPSDLLCTAFPTHHSFHFHTQSPSPTKTPAFFLTHPSLHPRGYYRNTPSLPPLFADFLFICFLDSPPLPTAHLHRFFFSTCMLANFRFLHTCFLNSYLHPMIRKSVLKLSQKVIHFTNSFANVSHFINFPSMPYL